MVQALGQPRYVPRSATNALKDLVEDHLEDLTKVYDERFSRIHGPLSPRVIDLLERYLRCGDPHFGFLRLRCDSCGHERLLPFSCKARGLCPSCGKRRATEWAERMVEDVLPDVPYSPLVFTIPKILRRAFLFDRRLYRDLCRSAYRVVRQLLETRFPHLDRPVPALCASPQSFGSLLNFHPHAHALVSRGVFDREGHFHDDPDVDFSSLELPFRDALLTVLQKRDKVDDERVALIRSWPHSGFRVHAERTIPPGNPTELESLLEYFERPPVSLKRLSVLDTGMVHYQGRYHPGLGTDHQLVTGLEFLALLVPHIQRRYECKIHCYGALSTTLRKRWGWVGARPGVSSSSQAKPSDPPESDFTLNGRRTWAQLIQKVWLDDPTVCERCGGTMKITAAFVSTVQDDAIRAILEARGEWDPPWLRTRAPPVSHATPDDPATEGDAHVEYDVDPNALWDDL